MVIYLEQVNIQELSEDDIQALRKLTNSGNNYSVMIDYLPKHQCTAINKNCCYKELEKSSCVFVARKVDETIVGWTLLQGSNCSCCDDTIHTYVDKAYRKMGIGKLLVNEILAANPQKSFNWNETNRAAKKMYNSFPRLQERVIW